VKIWSKTRSVTHQTSIPYLNFKKKNDKHRPRPVKLGKWKLYWKRRRFNQSRKTVRVHVGERSRIMAGV
jgi:hypothetical protein